MLRSQPRRARRDDGAGRDGHGCDHRDGRSLDRYHHALSGARRGAAVRGCGRTGGGPRDFDFGPDGDPNNRDSFFVASGLRRSSSPATQAATAVATQSAVGGGAATDRNVFDGATSSADADCSTLPAAFGVNPMVTVQVSRASLPTFFSRIWGNTWEHGQRDGDRRGFQSLVRQRP